MCEWGCFFVCWPCVAHLSIQNEAIVGYAECLWLLLLLHLLQCVHPIVDRWILQQLACHKQQQPWRSSGANGVAADMGLIDMSFPALPQCLGFEQSECALREESGL